MARDGEDALALSLDLVLGHEDVRVVLLEAAHAQQPVQGARALEAVQHAPVGEAQWQLAVAARAQVEDHHRVGAVHRLGAVGGLLVHRDDEDVVAVVLPVPGDLPETLLVDDRGGDLLVAAAAMLRS